jgi:PHD/YefM family antitoxin component YafN of YafNO toxin-antitoxin module
MEIKSATALLNDYDSIVRLSKEKRAPIFITRNGECEMVFLPIELWEKREAELSLLAEMLRRERSMLSGSRTMSMDQMEAMTEEILREDSVAI